MPSTEQRVRKLLADNLEVDGQSVGDSVDFSRSLSDIGVSSMDIVAFARVVQTEFGVEFTPENCAELATLSQLVGFLDARGA